LKKEKGARMTFTPDEFHDLVGSAARLNAVLSLLRDPESRAALDNAQTDRDVLAALEKFETTWKLARERGKEKT
jgi:hypothetical protein